MLHLANAGLTVALLDPVADRARLGARFCAGGFIWQVTDHHAGPLLAGPEWPRPLPAPHNGQGLPESFRHSTTTGQPLLWQGATGLAPGAGVLGRDAAGTVVVTGPCDWQTVPSAGQILFWTQQQVAGWHYALERTVALHDRILVSTSRLTNRGTGPLTLEWFAHPFFALHDGVARVTLPPGTALPENPGYRLIDGELTFRRAFAGERDGHLDHLVLPPGQPLTATVTHPKLEYIRFATDFAPFKCVIWANGNTLSLEPFLALHLRPGESRQWGLTYEFGSPAA